MMDSCPETPTCKACSRVGGDAQPVSHFCTDCDELMCEKCIVAHNKQLRVCHNKLTLAEYHSSGLYKAIGPPVIPQKKRKVNEIGPDANVCKIHPKTRTNLFCQDCKQFLCKDCLSNTKCSENLNHKHECMANPSQSSNQSVSPLLDKAKCALAEVNILLENLNEQAKAFQTFADDMVNQRSHRVQQINNVCEENNKIVSQRVEKQIAQFNKDKDQIESKILELTELANQSSMALDSNCSMEIVKSCSPSGGRAKTTKFEHCKTLADKSLAAHINSALGYSIEYKTIVWPESVTDAAYAEKVAVLFVGCHDGIYRLQEGGPMVDKDILKVHSEPSYCLSWNGDQKQLVSSSRRRTITIFTIGEKGNIRDQRNISVPRGYQGDRDWPRAGKCAFHSVSVSPDGERLALIDRDDGYSVRVITHHRSHQVYEIKTRSLLDAPVRVSFLDDYTLCVVFASDLRKGEYYIQCILLTKLDSYEKEKSKPSFADWKHTVLWQKQLQNDSCTCADGMIFVEDEKSFKVLNRHGDDVGVLTCPEGDPVRVCTMNNGMLMAISKG